MSTLPEGSPPYAIEVRQLGHGTWLAEGFDLELNPDRSIVRSESVSAEDAVNSVRDQLREHSYRRGVMLRPRSVHYVNLDGSFWSPHDNPIDLASRRNTA